MKIFAMTLCVAIAASMFATVPASANDELYAGPAKMDVRTFWRQSAIFKSGKGTATTLSNMERALASIKQKDPGFNIHAMDAEIADAQAQVDAGNANRAEKKQAIAATAQSGHDAIRARLAADKILEYLFTQSLTTGSPDSAKLQAILNEYNAKAAELLAMNFGQRDRTNQHLRMTFAVLDGRVTGSTNSKGATVGEKPSEDENEMLGDASAERVKSFFYRLQLGQAKWDAARKLFPGEPGYAAMYQAASTEIAKYGSVEDLQKTIEKNNLAAIQNRRLPAPEMIDATTERLFVDSFNKYLSDEMKGRGYKAILKQKDWGIIRNPITGIVMGRKRQAAVVYKGNEGKCYVRLGIIVEEQYISGSFQSAKAFDARYGGGELPCEYAK
jgi:hypothetical protein